MPQQRNYETGYLFAPSLQMEPAAMRHALYVGGVAFMGNRRLQGNDVKSYAEEYLIRLFDHTDAQERTPNKDDQILDIAGFEAINIATAAALKDTSETMLRDYGTQVEKSGNDARTVNELINARGAIRAVLPIVEKALEDVWRGDIQSDFTAADVYPPQQ